MEFANLRVHRQTRGYAGQTTTALRREESRARLRPGDLAAGPGWTGQRPKQRMVSAGRDKISRPVGQAHQPLRQCLILSCTSPPTHLAAAAAAGSGGSVAAVVLIAHCKMERIQLLPICWSCSNTLIPKLWISFALILLTRTRKLATLALHSVTTIASKVTFTATGCTVTVGLRAKV